MSFQNIDSLHRILDVPASVDRSHRQHSIQSHRREQIIITKNTISLKSPICRDNKPGQNSLSNNLARHGRLCDVYQRLPPQRIDPDAQLILHKLDSLFASQPIASDDRRRMNLRLYQLICAAKELCGDNDNRGRPIAHFLVLFLREVHKDTTSRVLNVQERENSCTVVRDSNFLYKIVSASLCKSKRVRHTPMLSTSILSRPIGPNELLTMLAMDCAAMTVHGTVSEFKDKGPIFLTILIADVLPRDAISSKERTSSRIALEHFTKGREYDEPSKLKFASGSLKILVRVTVFVTYELRFM